MRQRYQCRCGRQYYLGRFGYSTEERCASCRGEKMPPPGSGWRWTPFDPECYDTPMCRSYVSASTVRLPPEVGTVDSAPPAR